MEYKEFGHSGINLSRIGLGCFSMSGAYGEADDDEETDEEDDEEEEDEDDEEEES